MKIPSWAVLLAVCGLVVGGVVSYAKYQETGTFTFGVPQSDRDTYTTQPGHFAAATKADLQEAIRYAEQGNEQAVRAMVKQGRLFDLQPGLTVLLEECAGTVCTIVKVRELGQTTGFYTVEGAIERID